ncbi:MAG: M56 family metallopeptidase, partial [Gemmatimonadetes bacterium]|nr:M56 family metallopeptidase [Gemmatimonadota bacterium]
MPSLAIILLGAAARGAVVLLGALVLTSLLHRRPAAVRHAIWAGAIAVQLLLPLLALWGPRWHVPVPETLSTLIPDASIVTADDQSRDASPVLAPYGRDVVPPTTPRAGEHSTLATPSAPPAGATRSVATTPAPAATAPAATAPVTTPAPLSLRTVLLVIWALGAAVVVLRLAAGTLIVARLARRGARIDDGGWLSLAQRLANTLRIQRPLILLRGDRLGVPVTWGVVYPIVLLPEDADEWTEERRRYVLVHEMAHVKRLDALTQLLGQVALALFWFNPLVWIANRRLQLEREHACDDYVLRHGTQPSTYAADLLSMVQSLGTPAHRSAQPAFAALAMARRSEFEGRMLSILDPVLDRHPLSRGRTLMSALATLLLVVPLAALQPIRQTPQSSAGATHSDSATASRSASQSRTQSTTTQGQNIRIGDSTWKAAADGPLGQGLRDLDSATTTLGRNVAVLGKKVGSADTIRSRVEANGGVTETVSGGDDDSCDQLRFGDSNASFHMHDNVDDHSARSLRMLSITRDHCVQAMIQGRFTTTPAEDRITSLASGSTAIFRERVPGADRAVTITPATAGSDAVRIQYRFNEANAPFDDAAQRWLAGILPQVLAEAGVNVEARIARWRAEGGMDAVLRHIAALRSSGAKRAHYDALLDQKLPAAELERVVAQAGKDVPSSSDLRAVLSKAAAQSRTGGVAPSALEKAAGAVASSTDRTAVLEAFGQTDDRDQLLAVARAAATIASSTDKTNLMSTLAPKYLARNDAALRDAFFKTVVTIPSSTDLSNVLEIAIPFAAKSNDVALAILAADTLVASSTDRSNVLIALAGSGAVRTPAVRDAYLRAVQGIPSSTDMRNAL